MWVYDYLFFTFSMKFSCKVRGAIFCVKAGAEPYFVNGGQSIK